MKIWKIETKDELGNWVNGIGDGQSYLYGSEDKAKEEAKTMSLDDCEAEWRTVEVDLVDECRVEVFPGRLGVCWGENANMTFYKRDGGFWAYVDGEYEPDWLDDSDIDFDSFMDKLSNPLGGILKPIKEVVSKLSDCCKKRLEELFAEINNVKTVQIDREGGVWIENPQRGHWLNDDEYLEDIYIIENREEKLFVDLMASWCEG